MAASTRPELAKRLVRTDAQSGASEAWCRQPSKERGRELAALAAELERAGKLAPHKQKPCTSAKMPGF